MSTDPPPSPDEQLDALGDEYVDDQSSIEFLRDIARVEDRPPPSHTERLRLEGTNIGRFKVISEIGRGGMGIVLLAEDEALRRKVALKLLPPSFAADEERRRRFLREARAAAAVSHPNLVTVYDVGEHEGRAYIAMEYLRGRSLRELMSERPLSLDESLDFARQILAGLSHAHAAGLLHRDLKPENVLVDRDNRLRLVDFGLAKLDGDHDGVERTAGNSTRDGLVMGTPGYMSPEQARGQDVDARSDLFSFGVVLYEMLTRRRPFAGPTRADILSALLRDEAPRVSTLRPDASESIADVVSRCLAKAPDDRYASAVAVAEALGDASTVSKSTADLAERPITTGPSPVPAASDAPARPSRWNRVAGGLAAAAIAAALALVVRARSETPAPAVVSGAAAAADGGAKKGIAITDLPPPKSSNQAALASYRQAMQAIRDADWSTADERLRAAVQADPDLAAGYLRLAIIAGTENGGPLQPREDLARAMGSRANLSPRDQDVLMAFEPKISRPQSELHVTKERLHKLTETYPDDADVWHLFAMFGAEETTESVAAERHATALDPQFADAWQILGKELAHDGNIDEALAALEKCVAISPLSVDCHAERARIFGILGDCTKMEENLRRGFEASPRAASIWQDERAASLLAVGRGDEAILESYRQKWAPIPAERRKGVEQRDRALLAAARGRFADAESALDEGEKAIESDTSVRTHALYAGLRAEIEQELGRPKEAAKVMEAYLARQDVWIRSGDTVDPEIAFLRLLVHGGLVTAAELGRRREAWWAQSAQRPVDWMLGWGWGTTDAAEATEALKVYDGLPVKLATSCTKVAMESNAQMVLGHNYLLAGQAQSAVSPLEIVTTQCDWLDHGIERTRALFDLGQAHEALGNTENACEAYQRVIARWSAAKKSVTLDRAKARVKALSCGVEARRAPIPAAMSGPHIEKERAENDEEEDEPGAPPSPPPPPPPAPLPPFGAPRTRVGVGVIQGAERGKTCSDAKAVAIGQAQCKARSVEGNCDCHELSGAWICTAMMAVTCN